MKNPALLPTKATLLLASTLTVMSAATIAPSLPAMQEHFAQVSNAALWVRLVLTLPALFIVIGSPIAGAIADRFGRKPLLVACAALYGLAGSSGFVFDSLPAILCGRALLGLSVGGIMVSATALIADYFTGSDRASFMGLQAAFMGLGGVFFLTGGGALADLNWRLPFLIYLFAWLLLPMMVLFLYEPHRAKPNPLIQDAQKSASADAAAPVNLLILLYVMSSLSQIVFYLIPVQLPFYLKSLSNAGASESGMAIAFSNFFAGMASVAYGKIKQRLDFISILNLSFALIGIGYSIIGAASSYALVLVGLSTGGIGFGLLTPNLTVWLSARVPDSLRGRALGGLTTFIFLGQFLSPIFSQPASQIFGLPITYSGTGGLMLLFALLLLGMRRQVMTWAEASAGHRA